jgi:hypothetical protein
MAIDFYQGDIRPTMRAVLKRNEVPIDLSGASGVSFKLWRSGHEAYETAAVSGACAFTTDGVDGDVYYAWAATDLDIYGRFTAVFIVDWGVGENESIPDSGYIEVTVHPAT